MTAVYERLQALQISLPDTAPPIVAGYTPVFAPYVRTGSLVYLSGRLAKKEGQIWPGKLGAEITLEEGRHAARGVAIEMIAALHTALGDLEHVRRLVRLLVFVNCTPEFTAPHAIANGASELLVEVFGERGAHARSAVGVAQTPFGACVEMELIVEVTDAAPPAGGWCKDL